MINNNIEMATDNDRDEILALYKSQLGREFCPWDEHYPGNDEITYDLSRDALYVMRDDTGRIIAAISWEEDPQVDQLSCWSTSLQPGGELARMAVAVDMQNHGIAKRMVQFGLDLLKSKGYKSIHFLVNSLNEKALRSYAVFGFREVGECDMYEQHFICFEKELD